MANPTDFSGFSDAAKHYAANIPIVRAMQAQFDREMDGYIEDLNNLLTQKVPGLWYQRTNKKDGKILHYWLIGTRDGWMKNAGMIYTDASDGSVIAEGRLRIIVFGGLTKEAKRRIKQFKVSPLFADFKFVGESDWTKHFEGVLQLPEDDPVTFAADRLAALLFAIKDAEGGYPIGS